jgi:hypothetical protein
MTTAELLALAALCENAAKPADCASTEQFASLPE